MPQGFIMSSAADATKCACIRERVYILLITFSFVQVFHPFFIDVFNLGHKSAADDFEIIWAKVMKTFINLSKISE